MYRVRLTEASRWVFSHRAQVRNKEVSFVSRRSICQSRMTKKLRDFTIGDASRSISPDDCVRIYYNLLTLEISITVKQICETIVIRTDVSSVNKPINQLNVNRERTRRNNRRSLIPRSMAMLRVASEIEQRQDEARWFSSFSRSVSPRIAKKRRDLVAVSSRLQTCSPREGEINCMQVL